MLNIPTSKPVALLIDADNIRLNHLKRILEISAYYGSRKTCRAYGDWEKPPLANSSDKVRDLGIETIQVDRRAKDSTDKALLIEAGEILGEGSAETFIIASGDGDFRQLCERIRQKGRKVVGIGHKGHTSPHLRESCSTFHYIEDLEEALMQFKPTRHQEFDVRLYRALDSLPRDEEGWVTWGSLANRLRELDSDLENRFGR